MMGKPVLFMIFLALLLMGCSNKTIIFSGESDNWKGNYTANIDGTREDGEFVFGYKNATNNTEFKNLEVIINDGETIRKEGNHRGATVRIPTSCSGCLVTDKNEPIKVTVKWNTQKEETFLLKAR
jgi:major membrane immunogen (membrane-anchored lipoprotein)